MRLPIRTSRWATWSRRLASLALPLFVFSVGMHRAGMVSSNDFLALLGAVQLLAILAIISAIVGFVRLWYSGDKGWGRAGLGLALGLILLTPFFYASYLYVQFPTVNDVSTADPSAPALLFAHNRDAQAINGEQAATAFPGVSNRIYPMDSEPLFALVEARIQAMGWQVRRKSLPTERHPSGEIHALATTWLGWRDEVAVSVGASPAGSVVAMRSASMVGHTDFGTNGRRIAAFLAGLDEDVAKAQKGEK